MSTAAWGKFSGEYEKFASFVPLYFSEIAAGLLFPVEALASRHEPVHLIDVAGGPGTFVTATINHFQRSSMSFPTSSSITSTDFAEGMVTAARNKWEQADLSSLGNPTIQFQTLDGSDPHNVPDHHYTHFACMLGIMFFKNRAEGLQRLHQKLIPNIGRAVFSTWHSTGTKTICEDFSAFVDPSSVEQFQHRSTPLDICKDPAVLHSELETAGYRDVVITQHAHTFAILEEALLLILARNPPIVQAFPVFATEGGDGNGAMAALRSRWLQFLDSPVGKKWCRCEKEVETDGESGEKKVEKVYIMLDYCANIAVASAEHCEVNETTINNNKLNSYALNLVHMVDLCITHFSYN